MISARILGLVVATAATLAALGACGSDTGDSPSDTPDGSTTGDAMSAPDAYVPPTPAEFGLDSRPSNPTCKAPDRPPSTAKVKWVQVYNAATLRTPMIMAQIPGDSTRWFVALRGGGNGQSASIVSFTTAAPATVTPVGSVGPLQDLDSEGGLLGMAFHPKFAQNGKLFVSYTAGSPLHSMVGYLTSANKTGTDFGNTITPVFDFENSGAGNHKGGTIHFGKDGYLYMSFGDGGGGDDTFFNGQNKLSPFAKILRIDVDKPDPGKPYGIPSDNPWKTNPPPGGGIPEMFAWGFRNPFRFSIDRESNEVWVADVGQDAYEEIDAKVKNGGNYGWPCREGLHDSNVTNSTAVGPNGALHCPPGTVGTIDPIVERPHASTAYRAIIGGYVYRGKDIPDFVGSYTYADEVGQGLATISFDPNTGAAIDQQLTDVPPGENWVSFAEDNDGEQYALSIGTGHMFKLTAAEATTTSNFPTLLSKTGCFDPKDPTKPLPGLVPYGVNSPLWSDGAAKDRWMALPDGQSITVDPTSGDWDFPIGTVLLKTFYVNNTRIETRMFTRHDDGEWAGYTYEWNPDGKDATFLPSSKTKTVGTQSWYYPSRSDCVNCHNAASGHSLGLENGQQNGDYVYASTNRISNQLKTLDHIGMFGAPLGKPVDQIIAYPAPTGTTGTAEDRARAYLHSNCSMCHRPDGGGRGDMDWRYSNSFADTKSCNVDNQAGPLGAATKLIVPRHPEQSLVSVRPHSPAANRMPPLASSVVDNAGIGVVDSWITGITACP